MTDVAFTKMHGLGNDFVVIDTRTRPLALSGDDARAVADRHTGIGCDQLVLIEPSSRADAFMRIFNADGGEVGACGNATRCVASILFAENGNGGKRATIETAEGLLKASGGADGSVTVNMGAPRLDWREIPLSEEQDTLHLPLARDGLSDPVAVSMGNPHCVFFVDDAAAVDLAAIGPALETHALFPERANIGIAQKSGADRLLLRVWERGAGITLACGTGACAAAVAAARRGLTGRAVEIALDGGILQIDWRDDGDVLMTGPVATSFTGAFALADITGVSAG